MDGDKAPVRTAEGWMDAYEDAINTGIPKDAYLADYFQQAMDAAAQPHKERAEEYRRLLMLAQRYVLDSHIDGSAKLWNEIMAQLNPTDETGVGDER